MVIKMEICKDCLHKELCIHKARAMLNHVLVGDGCEFYIAAAPAVDIYKMADSITNTVKQVVLANLRTICDNEED